MIRLTRSALAAPVLAAALAGAAEADVRDVQITSIDLATGIVTLSNLGATDEPLDGFRLCTADDDQALQYSTGFVGKTIEAGTDFFVHFLSDADPADPDAINVSALGGLLATPLDAGPYGLALYWAAPFATPSNMADYVQWTDDLANPANATADARGGTATAAGLWTGATEWVVTEADTQRVDLVDPSGAELHGPEDYAASGPPCDQDCGSPADGVVGVTDLLALLGDWGMAGSACDIDGGGVGVSDLLAVLGRWGACP